MEWGGALAFREDPGRAAVSQRERCEKGWKMRSGGKHDLKCIGFDVHGSPHTKGPPKREQM